MKIDWKKYENFTKVEFNCRYSGKNEMRKEFMDVLQEIRTAYNKPMVITSGFRDKTHPVEVGKGRHGEHTYGLAVDIKISGMDAMSLFVVAYRFGVRRIGLSQKGSVRFMHLGWGDKEGLFPMALWTY